jgi:hypothetical protein
MTFLPVVNKSLVYNDFFLTIVNKMIIFLKNSFFGSLQLHMNTTNYFLNSWANKTQFNA